jgi:hypothetical protein
MMRPIKMAKTTPTPTPTPALKATVCVAGMLEVLRIVWFVWPVALADAVLAVEANPFIGADATVIDDKLLEDCGPEVEPWGIDVNDEMLWESVDTVESFDAVVAVDEL